MGRYSMRTHFVNIKVLERPLFSQFMPWVLLYLPLDSSHSPLCNVERIGAPRDPPEQLVGRRQHNLVELNAGVLKPGKGGGGKGRHEQP